MITVVLVDDEPVLLRSLKNLIESTDPDFKVIDVATNGQDGWRIVTQRRPDLLFADISMPLIDGLEMIEHIRQEGLQTHTVILSGLSEFEKAKRAIELGVAEYLVKPIDPRQFPSFLGQTKKRILEANRKRLSGLIEVYLANEVPVAEPDIPSWDKKLLVAKLCVGAYGLTHSSKELNNDPATTRDLARKTVTALLDPDVIHMILPGKRANEALILVDADMRLYGKLFERLFEAMVSKLDHKSFLSLCYSEEATPLLALGQKREQLDSLLYEYALFLEDSLVCLERTGAASIPALSAVQEKSLLQISMLSSGANERTREELIHRLFQEYDKRSARQLEIRRMLGRLFDLIDPDHMSLDHTRLVDRTIQGLDRKELLIPRVLEATSDLQRNLVKNCSDSPEAHMLTVAEHIDRHFTTSLKVTDLADRFGYSPSYLSNLFKKVIGVSPNDYITDRRMEHACWLLSVDPQLEVKKVAAACGFEDAYYFTRVFKTRIGVSPTEYRQDHLPG